jgi:hypothetical protein
MTPKKRAHHSQAQKGKKRKGLPPRLAKHWDVLSVLSKAPPPMRKQMIQTASKDVMDTVCECCLNVLKGTIPLSKHQKKCLAKHRHVLRQMVQKKIPIGQKKKMLVQRGGILPFLPLVLKGVMGTIGGPLLKGVMGTIGGPLLKGLLGGMMGGMMGE